MDANELEAMQEYFTLGHMLCESDDPMIKYAHGLKELYLKCDLCATPERGFAPARSLYLKDPTFYPHFNGMIMFAGWNADRLIREHPERERSVRELQEYWKTYDVRVAVHASLPEEDRALDNPSHGQEFFNTWQGHATLNYARILEEGFVGYRQRIRDKAAANPPADQEAHRFLHAISIVIDGLEALIQRYVDYYDQLLASDGNELEATRRLRDAFEQMLAGPPRSFFEAMQFVHFFNAVDGYDNVGRLDQYLLPFYRHDLRQGTTTTQEAQSWFTELLTIWGEHTLWQIVLGGLNAEGDDVSNELTLLIMAARHCLGKTNPQLSLRVSEKTPDEVLTKALELLGDNVAQPALYNEERYTAGLERIGIPHEDAVEFVLGGCTETHIAGKAAIRDMMVNSLMAVEMVLHNGHIANGNRLGLETGDPCSFGSFDAFLDAYKRQVEWIIDRFVKIRNETQRMTAELQPALIRSIFIEDCIDRGRSQSESGARYNYGMLSVYGIPNIANSLFAIRKLVFEEQAVSMEDLVTALKCNFEGHEAVRRSCLEQAKYGNDCDEVDLLAREVASHTYSHVETHRLWNGDIYYGFCASSPGWHVMAGRKTGATPDGRLAGTALGNSMGPVQGTDTQGILSMFNSVTKLDLEQIIGTPVINVSLGKMLFLPENRSRIIALIRTYFKKGGMQMQVSVLDEDVLRSAVKEPGKHRDLFVRVSGFCARFVDLGRALQEDVISRTVH